MRWSHQLLMRIKTLFLRAASRRTIAERTAISSRPADRREHCSGHHPERSPQRCTTELWKSRRAARSDARYLELGLAGIPGARSSHCHSWADAYSGVFHRGDPGDGSGHRSQRRTLYRRQFRTAEAAALQRSKSTCPNLRGRRKERLSRQYRGRGFVRHLARHRRAASTTWRSKCRRSTIWPGRTANCPKWSMHRWPRGICSRCWVYSRRWAASSRASDDRPEANATVVLTWGLWKRRLRRRPRRAGQNRADRCEAVHYHRSSSGVVHLSRCASAAMDASLSRTVTREHADVRRAQLRRGGTT